MSKWIDADALISEMSEKHRPNFHEDLKAYHMWIMWYWALKKAPGIKTKQVKYFDEEEKVWKIGSVIDEGEGSIEL